ncbi:MAG: hypothetical protein JKY99_00775 [Rhizobiales bacterium]|nr:hypothetical protein [Hyphomicrobiales bacterium]
MQYATLYRIVFGPFVALLTCVVVLHHVFGSDLAGQIEIPITLVLVLGGVVFFSKANRIMFFVAIVLCCVALFQQTDSGQSIFNAVANAAFLGVFFAVLGILRFVSQTSPTVHRCGAMLVSRPAGQRYAALAFGSLIFSTVLNFGSLILLGGMTRDANEQREDRDTPRRHIREQRMLMALLRGFTGTLVTSPTTFSFAIVLTFVPDLGWQRLLPLAFVTTIILLLVGWAHDRWFFPAISDQQPEQQNSDGFGVALPLILVLFIVLAGAALVESWFHSSLIEGVLLALPIVAIGWLYLQQKGGIFLRSQRVYMSFSRLINEDFYRSRQEVVFVMFLGFVSGLLAALATAYVPDGGLLNVGPHPALFILLVMATIIGVGLLGVNPLVSVSVLGSLLPPPESVGITPLIFALTLLSAWSLAAGVCQGVAAVHAIANIAKKSPMVVAMRWNGTFTLMAAPVVFAFLVSLNALLNG